MAQRPIWRGHLRLALVSCPVALFATRHEREAIRFNMINPATGNRIKMVSQDAVTGAEVARRDTVKGFEFSKGQYVLITDEDMSSVRVESSGLIKVEKFVQADSIDPIFFDASYYLAPDGAGSDDVYAVLREAIARTGKVALTRVVIAQRERTIALRPFEGGLVAHTLHEERDLHSSTGLFAGVREAAVDDEMVALAMQLVERQSATYDPADLEDRYETRLKAMLDAKVQGQAMQPGEAAVAADSNVVDLMAALRKSLGAPSPTETPAKRRGATAATRTQPALKLPIRGGKAAEQPAQAAPAPAPAGRSRRKAS